MIRTIAASTALAVLVVSPAAAQRDIDRSPAGDWSRNDRDRPDRNHGESDSKAQREQAARDKAVRDQAAREKAEKDRQDRERAKTDGSASEADMTRGGPESTRDHPLREGGAYAKEGTFNTGRNDGHGAPTERERDLAGPETRGGRTTDVDKQGTREDPDTPGDPESVAIGF